MSATFGLWTMRLLFFFSVWITHQVLKCGWRVITLLPQIMAKVKILTQKRSNLGFCKILRNKYQVLPKRVHLNGNIIGLCPQI